MNLTDRIDRCRTLLCEIDRLTIVRLDALSKAHQTEDAIRTLEEEMHALMRGHTSLAEIPNTAQIMAHERRQIITEKIVAILRNAGTPIKATVIAHAIGVDPHGLGRMIDEDPRIQKSYRSKRGTTFMWLELAAVDVTSV